MNKIKQIAILFSGNGTNFQNIINKLHNKNIDGITIKITIAISNKSDALGINIAKENNIPLEIIEHTSFNSREEYDTKLLDTLNQYNLDLVVLSGFMRILTPIFTDNIKAINIHPSLLPLYKGAKAIQKSFEGDEILAGVSVHHVTSQLDGGDIILQQSFEKSQYPNIELFESKIKEIEYDIYPKAIIKVLND